MTQLEATSLSRRPPSTEGLVDELKTTIDAARVIASGKALEEVSGDFGRVARGQPQVVVAARRTDEVRDVLRVANRLGVQVTPRGNGGNTEGQTVARSGIVLDLRGLRTIDIREARTDAPIAELGAGGTWAAAIDVVRRHSRHADVPSLQFPIVPGYKNLTVGGTLSVGGGGYRSHTRGLQVDHVSELEVVTGAGEVVVASPTRHADLFYAALGGGGQVGVITRATLVLIPDERAENKRLAAYELTYSDRERDRFVRAILDPSLGDVFYEVQGNAKPVGVGWRFIIKGSVDSRVVTRRELQRRFPGARVRRKMHALIRSGRHARAESMVYDLGMKLVRRWRTPHPWATTFLPMEHTADFFVDQIDRVDKKGLGRLGFVTLVPTRNPQRPYSFLQIPPGERFGSYGIFYLPADERAAAPLWEQLGEMQAAADAVGGKSYLADTLPPTVDAWKQYFGAALERVTAAKRAYDPNRVLKPLNPSQAEVLRGISAVPP